MRFNPRSNVTRSARRRLSSQSSGWAANRPRRSSAGFSHPSAFARETWFEASGTISRMHSRASARNASSGTRYRTGFVATAGTSSRSANRIIARISASEDASIRCSTATRSRSAPKASRNGAASRAAASTRPSHGEPPRVRAWPQQRHQPPGVRADLLRRHPRVTALPQHVRVGDQTAQVCVAGLIEREQRHLRIDRWRSRSTHRERGAEDRPHTLVLACGHEPGGTVETVAVGHGHRRHPELRRLPSELLRRERPLLHGEEGTDIEVHERRPHPRSPGSDGARGWTVRRWRGSAVE